jgi:hypothetical protein
MGSNKKRKWTVFFLIKAVSTDTAEELIDTLRMLMTAELSTKNAVILAINVNSANLCAIERHNKALVVKPPPTQERTTVFYLLRPVSGGYGNELKLIDEKPDFDITAEADIGGYLRNTILLHYTAKRYMLFTWDHGNGVTIFSGKSDSDVEELNFINKRSKDVTTLTMDELGGAILQALNGKKVDVMIMMNCLMMTMDTLYSLKDQTKYLVAPQSWLAFDAYDYAKIISKLARDPGISGKKMAAYVIKTFQENSVSNDTYIEQLLSASIAACRMSRVALFTSFFKQLIRELQTRNGAALADIKNAIKGDLSIVVYTGFKLSDLYIILTRIYDVATPQERELIHHLFVLYEDLLFKYFKGRWVAKRTGISMHTGSPPVGERTLFQEETQLPDLLSRL